MNKEELLKTMFLTTSERNEDNRRTHSHQEIPAFSELFREVMKQAREKRLEREKVFGKPKSKYHN